MKTRAIALSIIGVVLATAAAWLQTPGQPVQQGSLAARMPAGAALVLQAKDFGSLVGDWNGSQEKARWLASAHYQAFSRSRLFLRLNDAYGEFTSAAGVPPDMALLSDVAGTESALALYDIGNLEFLYITKLPAARSIENALWRVRGNYEPRQANGTPFYVRVDPESKRVVAFAARDQYLLLATREDLLAGALRLMAGQPGSSIETESWFARSIKAAGAPGDLRLVMNLSTLVKQPHFRSYWIQGNVAELRQYASAVSDLVRTPTELREERIFVRAEEAAAPAAGGLSLGEMARVVPDGAGLYRAWVAPSPQDATSLIFEKTIATSAATALPNQAAPRLGATGRMTAGDASLEARIDEEVRAPAAGVYQTAALAQFIGSQPLSGMVHIEATRPGSDRVFIDRGSVVVLWRSSDWPQGAAREAVGAVVDPVWTRAHIGMRWLDVRRGNQTFSQLEGLEAIAVAERGRMLFIANDPGLLQAVLDATARPLQALQGTYAAGFRHAIERDRFGAVMRLIDHAAATAENHEPLLFSENLVSLSRTLAIVDSASIVIRDAGATVSQTVSYRLAR